MLPSSWEDDPWCSFILKRAKRSPVTSQLLSKTSCDSPSFDPFKTPLNAAVERCPKGLQMIKKRIIGLFIMLLKPKVHY